jgi:hypothetical protein
VACLVSLGKGAKLIGPANIKTDKKETKAPKLAIEFQP